MKPGDDFIVETYRLDRRLHQEQRFSADDVRDIDLSTVHFLSGPIGVKGAEPGDLLVVDLLDIGAMPDSQWGFNGFFSKKNGGGFLTDHFPLAQKSIWDFHGMYTSSRHVPGVQFAGLIHPRPDRLPAGPEAAGDLWNDPRDRASSTTEPDPSARARRARPSPPPPIWAG